MWTERVCRMRALAGITRFSHKNAIDYYRLFASLLTDGVTSHMFYNENLKKYFLVGKCKVLFFN